MVEIKYTSFAVPPYEIKLDKKYLFGKDPKGYFYSDAKEKKYLDLDEIKDRCGKRERQTGRESQQSKSRSGTSQVVQWLRLQVPNVGW